MTRRIGACDLENAEAGPLGNIITRAGKIGGEPVTRLLELLDGATGRVGAHQRRRSLPERTGLHVLGNLGNPAVLVDHQLHRDSAAAHRRGPLHPRLRLLQPPEMRNGGGEPKNVAIVERGCHGADIGEIRAADILPVKRSFMGRGTVRRSGAQADGGGAWSGPAQRPSTMLRMVPLPIACGDREDWTTQARRQVVP